jgi:ABC-type nickel/cobalt efflux system permease component RcnA
VLRAAEEEENALLRAAEEAEASLKKSEEVSTLIIIIRDIIMIDTAMIATRTHTHTHTHIYTYTHTHTHTHAGRRLPARREGNIILTPFEHLSTTILTPS